MRLNQYIAHASGLSRRQADEAIQNGRVKVNKEPANLGQHITDQDTVALDGQTLEIPEKYTYLLLNKPVGYVCSRQAQGDTQTIYDLLPTEFHRLKTVGRLDKDSSGLVLLTDDGQLAHELTHPKHRKTKRYELVLNKSLSKSDFDHINRGVQLEDGISKLSLEGKDQNWVVKMHEGRNRQIRRTFAILGYEVAELHRTDFGGYTLDNLDSGQYKLLQGD